jgi:hypothetical protein
MEASMSIFTNPATGAAEHAAAYVRAVLELLGDREPIAVLREMPSSLPRAIEGLSPPQLRQPEQPGKWSIGQILHAERGEESVEHLRRLNAGHDLLHLRQIERIRRAIA